MAFCNLPDPKLGGRCLSEGLSVGPSGLNHYDDYDPFAFSYQLVNAPSGR